MKKHDTFQFPTCTLDYTHAKWDIKGGMKKMFGVPTLAANLKLQTV